MANTGTPRSYDAYGHPTDPQRLQNSGYTTSTSGTKAGTLVNPGSADPTGTTNIVAPWMVADSYGQFQITPKGTQATSKNLRQIYFVNPYPAVRPSLVVVSLATNDAAAGGTITVTMTKSSLKLVNGTVLASSGSVKNIGFVVL
jgi:hypothetical protein